MYNEHKPRLAVSGWFHAALPSEMGDWPDHTLDVDGTAAPEGDTRTGATSTLEQLKGAAGDGGGVPGGDGSECAAFADDFEGAQVGGVKEEQVVSLKRSTKCALSYSVRPLAVGRWAPRSCRWLAGTRVRVLLISKNCNRCSTLNSK